MTQTEKLDDLFDIVEELSIGMLVSENNNELRSRPMKAFPDAQTHQIWFLTKLVSHVGRRNRIQSHNLGA